MLIAAAGFVWIALLPVKLAYWSFAAALFANGFAMGLFASPDRAAAGRPGRADEHLRAEHDPARRDHGPGRARRHLRP
jgi:hypothetical protein